MTVMLHRVDRPDVPGSARDMRPTFDEHVTVGMTARSEDNLLYARSGEMRAAPRLSDLECVLRDADDV
jgi:hypothetical protein